MDIMSATMPRWVCQPQQQLTTSVFSARGFPTPNLLRGFGLVCFLNRNWESQALQYLDLDQGRFLSFIISQIMVLLLANIPWKHQVSRIRSKCCILCVPSLMHYFHIWIYREQLKDSSTRYIGRHLCLPHWHDASQSAVQRIPPPLLQQE